MSLCGPSNAGWEQVKVGVNIKTDDISLISCGTIQEKIVCSRNLFEISRRQKSATR